MQAQTSRVGENTLVSFGVRCVRREEEIRPKDRLRRGARRESWGKSERRTAKLSASGGGPVEVQMRGMREGNGEQAVSI